MVKDAPYKVISTIVTVQNEQVKVYYLGGKGKDIVNNAASRDFVYERTGVLNEKLLALMDVIGRDTIIRHFKGEIVKSLKKHAFRSYQLVNEPFYFEKSNALSNLLDEGTVIRNHGWIKLANSEVEA